MGVQKMNKAQLKGFELLIKSMWERGEIRCPVHLCGGNEQELMELFEEYKDDDYIFSTHRNHYHYLLAGGSPDNLLLEIRQDPKGPSGGRSGSMCTTDPVRSFFSSAIVGGMCAIAVGVALALKEKDDKRKVWCFVGDGGVDGGHFWEALQYAEGWDLPIVFVVEDNDRSTCTSTVARLGYKSMRDSVRYWAKEMSSKVVWYTYKPEYPHCGSGVYVQF